MWSLPTDKILDWSKLKAFAGDKLSLVQMMLSVSHVVENIPGKAENAGNQHFSFCRNPFKILLFQGRENPGSFGKGLEPA